MNRLRVDDMTALIVDAGLEIVRDDHQIDDRSLKALKNGLAVDAQFSGKPVATNATARQWVVARPPKT